MATHCETCGEPLDNRKNRYCRPCAFELLTEMRHAGYLQNTHVPRYFSEGRGRKGIRHPRALAGEPNG